MAGDDLRLEAMATSKLFSRGEYGDGGGTRAKKSMKKIIEDKGSYGSASDSARSPSPASRASTIKTKKSSIAKKRRSKRPPSSSDSSERASKKSDYWVDYQERKDGEYSKGMYKDLRMNRKAEVQIKELKEQISKNNAYFDVQKEHIKKAALEEAKTYVKEKSTQMVEVFTAEAILLLRTYVRLRNKSLDKLSALNRCVATLNSQERVVTELRAFIEEQLKQLITFVEKNKYNIEYRYKTEYQTALSGEVLKDPFRLFDVYVSHVQHLMPMFHRDDELEDLRDENKELKERVAALESLHKTLL